MMKTSFNNVEIALMVGAFLLVKGLVKYFLISYFLNKRLCKSNNTK